MDPDACPEAILSYEVGALNYVTVKGQAAGSCMLSMVYAESMDFSFEDGDTLEDIDEDDFIMPIAFQITVGA